MTDALAEYSHPVTVDQVLKLVDELANVSTPKPASGIVRLGLVTELRGELRPSLGSTGKGGGGATRIPIDPTALALWEDITARVQALPEDLGDPPATKGSLEQILNAWARDLVAADVDARTRQELAGRPVDGLNQDALTTIHRRVERIRDRIDEHFNPPRRIEYPYCPEPDCRATHVETDDENGDPLIQRALTVTFWPTNPDRPPLAECAVCGTACTGVDAIENLNTAISALAAEMEHDTYEGAA